jgi:hypothetical protein
VNEKNSSEWLTGVLWIVTLGLILATYLANLGANFDSLGKGTWRNAIVIIAMTGLPIAITWLCVRLTRTEARTSSEKRWVVIGFATIGVWFAGIFLTALRLTLFERTFMLDNLVWQALAPTANVLTVALIPALVWFPIWTIVAYIRFKTSHRKASNPATTNSKTDGPPTPKPSRSAVSDSESSSGLSGFGTGKSRLLVAIVCSILAIAALWVADQWVRSNELRAIVEEMKASNLEIGKADDYWTSTLERARQAGGSGSDYEEAASTIKRSAQWLNFDLTVNRENLGSLLMLPWHGDNRALRDRYADYLDTTLGWTSDLGNSSSAESLFAAHDASATALKTTRRLLVEQVQFMPLPLFAKDLTTEIDTATS